MRTLKMLALGLGMLALSGVALRADTLVLTASYNTISFNNVSEGGGSLVGATLNGVALAWVYCVQLNTNVNVPGTYNHSIVDNTGKIWNTDPNPSLAAAQQIAWLLSQYANGASLTQQEALQEGIWNVEVFGNLTMTGGVQTAYTNMLSALGTNTGNVANYDWMTPGTNGSNQYQGLVTVPDGGLTLMLLGGALVGLETLRRRFRV